MADEQLVGGGRGAPSLPHAGRVPAFDVRWSTPPRPLRSPMSPSWSATRSSRAASHSVRSATAPVKSASTSAERRA
ncbi:hypothetical protein J2Z21_008720 [Streptomyces griseochromogenes]|uniref:Uncharacterized protein n=1 Tax=Streptomyces griseochromogenes TaxID=68214 RepID=A0A1B1B0H7_9ACTN|nr:hypothetical protein [Streptomyces griseochromogenes]ANP52300.1 hypothetical protein AVL59_24595 [Streptomyces griseochromogenes]MBP2055704.1 hypothetical protein [Streptomyces griseochromogenes]